MIVRKELSFWSTMYIGDTDEIYSIYKSIMRASEKGSTHLHSLCEEHAKVNRMRRIYAILINDYTGFVDFISSDCALAILLDEGGLA